MNRKHSPRWELKRRSSLWWITGGSIVVLILVLIGYPFGKTLWDWLELLIVPLVLALGGYWLNWAQDKRQDAIETAQKVSQDAIEEQRRQHDRAIATRHAQDAALQSFLDHMSELLIDKAGTELQQLKPSPEVRRLMTARTTTVLKNLDTGGKQTVLRYLAEANLIADETPIISLEGTDLSRLNLSGLDLNKSNLADANLRGADLGGTNLRGADLQGADLSVATHDSTVTNLRGANLSVADDDTPTNLRDAKLRGANLAPSEQGDVTNLGGANLESADLGPAEDGTVTNLRSAILTNATLLDTNLQDAVLLFADLSDAKLADKQEFQQKLEEWTKFVNSDAAKMQQTALPSKPELHEAKGLTQEQIKQARGNETTELPHGLDRPTAWSKSPDEQKGILREQHGGT